MWDKTLAPQQHFNSMLRPTTLFYLKVCWAWLCFPPWSMYSDLQRMSTRWQGFNSLIFLRQIMPKVVLIFCLQMDSYEIFLAFHFYNCLLGKSVILTTEVFYLLVLENSKISNGVLFMIEHWFRIVLTLGFKFCKAGPPEYLLILFLINMQGICYFLAYQFYFKFNPVSKHLPMSPTNFLIVHLLYSSSFMYTPLFLSEVSTHLWIRKFHLIFKSVS